MADERSKSYTSSSPACRREGRAVGGRAAVGRHHQLMAGAIIA
jgi:hypothetical protein